MHESSPLLYQRNPDVVDILGRVDKCRRYFHEAQIHQESPPYFHGDTLIPLTALQRHPSIRFQTPSRVQSSSSSIPLLALRAFESLIVARLRFLFLHDLRNQACECVGSPHPATLLRNPPQVTLLPGRDGQPHRHTTPTTLRRFALLARALASQSLIACPISQTRKTRPNVLQIH